MSGKRLNLLESLKITKISQFNFYRGDVTSQFNFYRGDVTGCRYVKDCARGILRCLIASRWILRWPDEETATDPPMPPLKPTKVTFFTTILYNSENNIRDIRPFCRPLFCHCSVVKYTSSFYSSKAGMRLD